MYLAYLDESGEVSSSATTHFVLVACAIPAETWKTKDRQLVQLKTKHRLPPDAEAHTAWMIRKYSEQEHIPNFTSLSDSQRKVAMLKARKAELAKASLDGQKAVFNRKKNFDKTAEYIHLTHAERLALLRELADLVGSWTDCRLFGDAQMKAAHFGPAERMRYFAFEQVVTRFHTFLKSADNPPRLGLILHDRNETAATRLTELMREYHKNGTTFSEIPQIIETPLFVDSRLTSMVQVADLVSYAVRRFIEHGETDLFDRVYPAFDRRNGVVVGLRHFTAQKPCLCRICLDHKQVKPPATGS